MFIRFRKRKDDVHELSDHDLLQLYRKTKDTQIIGILFQRYTHLVFGVSLKYLRDQDEAKDAVMEVFEQLIEDLLVHEVRNFKSWLHSVTRNHCLMKLRKNEPVSMEVEHIIQKIDAESMELEEDLHQSIGLDNFTQEDLDKALQGLKDPQRKCLEMFYLQGKSYQEVVNLTGFSMNEVKSHIQNGKRNLKISMEARYARKR